MVWRWGRAHRCALLTSRVGRRRQCGGCDNPHPKIWWEVDPEDPCRVLGSLDWNYKVIRVLPESIGRLKIRGNLNLSNNELSCLPASFGSITVGGHLWLSNNELSSLPASFGSITVGGDLWLFENQFGMFHSLPSLPNVKGEVREKPWATHGQ